ncbi:MAG: hypothetical protein M3N52_05585 [Actinomycetota bacterium]|nr:hypothetical protein [Actinomycetota bacterium]
MSDPKTSPAALGHPPDVVTTLGDSAVGAPASALAGTIAADLALVVAPSTGRFRPRPLAGPAVDAGELLGHVTGGRGRADEVRCPVDATVGDLLVRPGQLVAGGQGLLWLRRRKTS